MYQRYQMSHLLKLVTDLGAVPATPATRHETGLLMAQKLNTTIVDLHNYIDRLNERAEAGARWCNENLDATNHADGVKRLHQILDDRDKAERKLESLVAITEYTPEECQYYLAQEKGLLD